MSRPRVAVVVPVHGRLKQTLRFIESFRRVEYRPYEIVIVDDASLDGTTEALARDHPDVVVLPGDGKLWWTGGTNLGVRYALDHDFDYVLTINNDTCVAPAFLESLVKTAEQHAPCVVGCRIQFLDEPQRVWGVGACMHWGRRLFADVCERDSDEAELLGRLSNPVAVEMLPGCGALVPAACYRAVGLYDGRMFPHYHADSEFTLRAARGGYRILVDLNAVVYLDEPETTRKLNLFRLRSPMYWRPLLAMYLRYCPPQRLPPVLAGLFLRGMKRLIVPRRARMASSSGERGA